MIKIILTGICILFFTTAFTQNYIGGHMIYAVIPTPTSNSIVCDTSFSFPTVDNWPGGLAFDGTYFYSIAADSATMIKYDITGQFSGYFPLPNIAGGSTAGDISFDGTNLWVVVEQDNMLYKINQNTGTILSSFPLPSGSGTTNDFFGCAYDNGFVWVAQYFNELLVKIDATTGAVVNTFNINRWVLPLSIINGDLWGVDFINNSASGQMQLVKFDKITGAVVDSVPWCLDYPLGLTMANGSLWGLSSGINIGTARIYNFESLPLSINQTIGNNLNFKCFPNPVQNKLIIETDKLFQLEVINISGAIILKKEPSFGKIELDVSKLVSGMYFIKVVSDKNSAVQKFLKY